MPEWIDYYEDNREFALQRIKNMALSVRYRKELSMWINKYLDPFVIFRIVSAGRSPSDDTFRRIRMEAEKDLEFTILTASKRDRKSSDILLFESNLLLLFNMMLAHMKKA